MEKNLNIAQLHWGFPPIIGGVETHLTILLPQMVKKGHNVSLLTGSVEGVEGKYKYEGVNIHRTPLMDLNWLYKRGLKGLDDEVTQTFSNFLEEGYLGKQSSENRFSYNGLGSDLDPGGRLCQ